MELSCHFPYIATALCEHGDASTGSCLDEQAYLIVSNVEAN